MPRQTPPSISPRGAPRIGPAGPLGWTPTLNCAPSSLPASIRIPTIRSCRPSRAPSRQIGAPRDPLAAAGSGGGTGPVPRLQPDKTGCHRIFPEFASSPQPLRHNWLHCGIIGYTTPERGVFRQGFRLRPGLRTGPSGNSPRGAGSGGEGRLTGAGAGPIRARSGVKAIRTRFPCLIEPSSSAGAGVGRSKSGTDPPAGRAQQRRRDPVEDQELSGTWNLCGKHRRQQRTCA